MLETVAGVSSVMRAMSARETDGFNFSQNF
jgi:hypothetical protein